MKVYLLSLLLSLLSSAGLVAMSTQADETPEKYAARLKACNDSYMRTLTASFAATR